MSELEARGVLCARVQHFREAMNDPQVVVNNMVVEMDHPRAGPLKMLGTPIRLHGTPAQLKQTLPDPSEQNNAIAAKLGYFPSEIEAMIDTAYLAESCISSP